MAALGAAGQLSLTYFTMWRLRLGQTQRSAQDRGTSHKVRASDEPTTGFRLHVQPLEFGELDICLLRPQ